MDWNEFGKMVLTNVMNIVTPLIASLLVALLIQSIVWVAKKIKKEKPDAFEVLERLAYNAVMAAEQAKLGNLIENKKEFALEYVHRRLAAYGIDIPEKEISDEIERAVYEAITQFKKEYTEDHPSALPSGTSEPKTVEMTTVVK